MTKSPFLPGDYGLATPSPRSTQDDRLVEPGVSRLAFRVLKRYRSS